jgi:hypothetical protein
VHEDDEGALAVDGDGEGDAVGWDFRHGGEHLQARKRFFFEKKKQKTFSLKGFQLYPGALAGAIRKSFLVLFFKKELLA